MDQSEGDGSSSGPHCDVANTKSEADVEVLLFAGAAEIAGARTIKLNVQLPIDIHTLIEKLRSQYPQLAPFMLRSRFAVNQSFVGSAFFIRSSADEIAMIPPVSGG